MLQRSCRRRTLSSYPVSFGKTEERKPKHVEGDTMIGLRSDRRVDRESIDERDDDVCQQLNRHPWTKLQKRKQSVHCYHRRFTPCLC